VQIGRVALIVRGPDEGKLCVIVDVIDGSSVLVDGPSSINGVARQPLRLADLRLTDIVVKIPPKARLTSLLKAYKTADVDAKWAKTATSRKLAQRKARANLSDFDRFKVRHAKKTRQLVVASAGAKK
jgi:large subunit ribosomal protein L14e